MKPILLAAFAALMLFAAASAHAQSDSRELIDLRNQVLEMRRDMQSLRDQVGRGGSSLGSARSSAPIAATPAPTSDVTAALLDRVTQLEERVRQLQGRADEEQNARQRQGEDLQKNIDDLAFKVGQSAPAAAPAAPAATPTKPAGLPAAPVIPPAPKRTPELAMQEGNAALARRDYATAEKAAREVLATPKTPRGTDAQFLLAQSLYGKKDWQGAAIAYDDAYSRSKPGPRAQDALLGLANSLTAINEKKTACVTLNKLKAEFPSPRADLRDSIVAARQHAGCA